MTRVKSEEDFWNWFVQHEDELFNFDPHREDERERLFDELEAELKKVDADLCFEFGPTGPKREFVISAGGIKRAFPAVVSLVKVAPFLNRWKLTAFRPRRSPNVLEFQGRRLDPNDVHFTLLDNRTVAGIYLFVPGFRENDAALKQIGYLLLDEALGEYDVESRLGLIKIMSPETRTEGERYPLVELPMRFNRLVSRLEGKCRDSS